MRRRHGVVRLFEYQEVKSATLKTNMSQLRYLAGISQYGLNTFGAYATLGVRTKLTNKNVLKFGFQNFQWNKSLNFGCMAIGQ